VTLLEFYLPAKRALQDCAGLFQCALLCTVREVMLDVTPVRVYVCVLLCPGTLTKNEMTVVAMRSAGAKWTVSGVGYEPSGKYSLK
jgi:hypothetical protein